MQTLFFVSSPCEAASHLCNDEGKEAFPWNGSTNARCRELASWSSLLSSCAFVGRRHRVGVYDMEWRRGTLVSADADADADRCRRRSEEGVHEHQTFSASGNVPKGMQHVYLCMFAGGAMYCTYK
jgi:hypothetical protein